MEVCALPSVLWGDTPVVSFLLVHHWQQPNSQRNKCWWPQSTALLLVGSVPVSSAGFCTPCLVERICHIPIHVLFSFTDMLAPAMTGYPNEQEPMSHDSLSYRSLCCLQVGHFCHGCCRASWLGVCGSCIALARHAADFVH